MYVDPFITWRKFVEETRLTRLEINFSNKKKYNLSLILTKDLLSTWQANMDFYKHSVSILCANDIWQQ